MDLFGEETEEDQKAAEEREAAKKASTKKKESKFAIVLLNSLSWSHFFSWVEKKIHTTVLIIAAVIS